LPESRKSELRVVITISSENVAMVRRRFWPSAPLGLPIGTFVVNCAITVRKSRVVRAASATAAVNSPR
jgi:hypothetical protein